MHHKVASIISTKRAVPVTPPTTNNQGVPATIGGENNTTNNIAGLSLAQKDSEICDRVASILKKASVVHTYDGTANCGGHSIKSAKRKAVCQDDDDNGDEDASIEDVSIGD